MGRNANAGLSASASAASSGSVPSQAQVTATDGFVQGDLVFMDYQANTIHNLNAIVAANALAAGPAIASYSTGQSGITAGGANTLTLPDGSFAVLAWGYTGSNTYMLTATRYDIRGVQIARCILEQQSVNSLSSLNMVLLSNGNIGISYLLNSTTGKWAILNGAMAPLYTGSTSGATIHMLQETTNGGFFIIHVAGISFVSATGTLTAVVTDTISYLATQPENNDNQANLYNTRCNSLSNLALLPISSGGFGVLYANNTGVNYVQLNATGTQRGTSTILNTFGSQGTSYLSASINAAGGIGWAHSLTSNTGFYGVVSEAGVVAKAATTLGAAITSGQIVRIIADPVGDFVIIASTSGTAWNILYVSAAGVPKAGYPQVLGTRAGSGYGEALLRLSTGVVFIYTPTLYAFKSALIPTGAAAPNAVVNVWDFISGNSGNALAALVFNDNVYGMALVGGGGNADMTVFSVANTGAAESAPQITGVSIPGNQFAGIAMDPSGLSFNVFGTGIIGTFTLDKKLVQTYISGNIQSNSKWKVQSYSVIQHQSNTNTVATLLNIKLKSTVLLGVADAAAAANSALKVNTKGVYKTTFKGNKSFDHSANNPPGNSGFVSNGVVNLKGF